MKRIMLTGGGTGGHIYPLVAVAEKLLKAGKGDVEVIYMGPASPLNGEFTERGVAVYEIPGIKLRRYFSPLNFIDAIKFPFAFIRAIVRLFSLMPDAVFSKGGPGALTVILAAKFYFIPIMIHESDSVPGLTNKISAKFAKLIAVSFENAKKFFPPSKTIVTGVPVREEILAITATKENAKGYLRFDAKIPLILVLGGSQGARKLNEFVTDNLEELTKEFQVYHQMGGENLKNSGAAAESSKNYKAVGYLNAEEMGFALKAADVVLSRAGAGALYEIAAFGKPAVLVPLPPNVAAQNHQFINAHEYAKTSEAIIIEEGNLTPRIVITQIKKLLEQAAPGNEPNQFFKPGAADVIARELTALASK